MADAMFAELMAVVGRANGTNRLASGYQVRYVGKRKELQTPPTQETIDDLVYTKYKDWVL